MNFLSKIKYIIITIVVCLVILLALYLWNQRYSYTESEYFINYLPFAAKHSVAGGKNPYLKELKLEQVNLSKSRVSAMRLPVNCQIDYYLKVPKTGRLNISFKHYGPQRTKALLEFKISLQEENHPVNPLFAYKFSKEFLDNQWKTEQISLTPYGDKIVKLCFSIVRYGSVSKRSEGLLLRPLLMINKHLLERQAERTSPVRLNISKENLRKTNVIIMVLDAARSDHFGCYGYHRPTTPHIDRLAQEAVLFKNAFSVAPYTAASTTSLFTSLHSYTHRVNERENQIHPRITTLAEKLSQNGYTTYGSGFIMSMVWANRDFKEIFDLYIKNKDVFTDYLYRFLRKNFSNKKGHTPAFIYIHLKPPHSPYNPPEEFDKWTDSSSRTKYAELAKSSALGKIDAGEKSVNKEELQFIIDKYDGNLLWGDWLVHMILEGFKKFGLFDNSLIILASDHGEAFLEHGRMLHVSTVYNEMIKIPIIMKFPSYIKPKKRVIEAYVENIDIMPTVLDFLQIERSYINLQGKSLLPLIFSNTNKLKPYLFAKAFHGLIFTLYDSQYKYVHLVNKGELFHMQSDSQQKNDLASSKPILFGYYQSLALFYRQQLIKARLEKPPTVKLDEETKKKLRALGYLK